MSQNNQSGLTVLDAAKEVFALALQDAQSLDIVNNMSAAFDCAIIVNRLEQALTDEVMQRVFMPLMNKKIGFLTDRDPNKPDRRTGIAPKPYDIATVRTCIIDAVMMGLAPVGNQFNIITGGMYPTKGGFTALLTKLKRKQGLVYNFEHDPEASVKSADPSYVAIPCRIFYKTNRDDLKGWFKYVAMVKSNGETSTTDQLRGKAERKCKKAFLEFLTGLDLGDGDIDTVDVPYKEVVDTKPATPALQAGTPQPSAAEKAKQILSRIHAEKGHTSTIEESDPADIDCPDEPLPPQEQPANDKQIPMGSIQPNLNFDNMTDEQIDAYVNEHMTEEGGLQ